MTTSIFTYENSKLLYSHRGRSIQKFESKFYQNRLTPDVNVTVLTLSSLNATKVLDNETDISRVNVEDEEVEEESSDKSVFTDLDLLLSQIHRNGPTSENGSIAFLKLCLKVEQIEDIKTFEKLISRYKTKKIFKFFVEATSVIHKTEFLNRILSHLSKLKNKMFLGKLHICIDSIFN